MGLNHNTVDILVTEQEQERQEELHIAVVGYKRAKSGVDTSVSIFCAIALPLVTWHCIGS